MLDATDPARARPLPAAAAFIGRARGRGRSSGLPAVVVALVVAALVVPPMWSLVQAGFLSGTPLEPGGATLEHFRSLVSRWENVKILLNTVLLGLGVTAFGLVLGTAQAILVHRGNVRLPRVLDVLFLLPLLLPSYLTAIAWTFIAGPGGLVERLTTIALPLQSFIGLICVMGVYSAPVAYLVVGSAVRSMDDSLEEAAAVTGLSPRRILGRITLPLLKPALASAALLVFAKVVGEFGIPAIIGIPARIPVVMTVVYQSTVFSVPSYGVSSALAAVTFLLAMVAVFLQMRGTKRRKRYAVISGKRSGGGGHARAHRRRRWYFGLPLLYAVVAVAVPYVILMYEATQPFLTYEILSPSLETFRETLSYPGITQAIQHSLLLAVACAALSSALGVAVAYTAYRSRGRGGRVSEFLSSAASGMPPLLVSLGLLFLFIGTPLFGTLTLFLIAYLIHNVAYSVRTSATGMIQVSQDLDEAAGVCGASRARQFRTIVFPLVRAPVLAGSVLVFIFVVKEMGPVLLLRGTDTTVLPAIAFSLYEHGQYNEVAALAVVMVGIILVALAALRLIPGRQLGDML